MTISGRQLVQMHLLCELRRLNSHSLTSTFYIIFSNLVSCLCLERVCISPKRRHHPSWSRWICSRSSPAPSLESPTQPSPASRRSYQTLRSPVEPGSGKYITFISTAAFKRNYFIYLWPQTFIPPNIRPCVLQTLTQIFGN